MAIRVQSNCVYMIGNKDVCTLPIVTLQHCAVIGTLVY